MLAIAYVQGTFAIRTPTAGFVSAFAQRIRRGLLGGARQRDRYAIVREEAGLLAFRAEDWATAWNVGLNDVEVKVSPDGQLRYEVRYQRWAAFALGLSALLGLAMVAILLALDLRVYLQRHAASRVPGLSIGQNVAVAWGMVAFWGFVWPWILIALHRHPVRRLLERIISEVDAAAGT